MCCKRRHCVTKTRSGFLKMFAGNLAAGDELGDGITSSMNVLYDLDAADQGIGMANNNSWDWNSNLSTPSSNYSSGQQNLNYEPGMNFENGDRSQRMNYQDPIWNEGNASAYQMFDQNGYNQYNTQHHEINSIDSMKQVGQMQSSYENYATNYNTSYNQHGRNTHVAHSPMTHQSSVKGNISYHQRGLHQRCAQQGFGTPSSGSNFKILSSKRFAVGNVAARECGVLGQRGILGNGFVRKSLGGANYGHPPALLKNNLGGLGHGLIKIAGDSTLNAKMRPLVFHDPPYQREKPLYVLPSSEGGDNAMGRNIEPEKPFSPTAIEFVSASTDDEDWSTPSSPQVVEVKTVPIRNTIFGFKKLKFRCMRCGDRDATFNSLLTHVKSHGKPFCMQCGWIGDHALQLKAHVEKAHPRMDSGSDFTMVTSKYGRKCQVYTSVAVGLKRKKSLAKSPQKSTSERLVDAVDEKPKLKENRHLEMKTEALDEVKEAEKPKQVDPESCTPVPKKEQAKGRVQSPKLATPPSRELSKRRLAMMAKIAQKEEETPPSRGKVAQKVSETPPSKGKAVPKVIETPPSKGKVAQKLNETPSPKGNLAPKVIDTPPSKGKISPLREMPKRGLRKK